MKKFWLLLPLLAAHVFAMAQMKLEDSLKLQLSRAAEVPARLFWMSRLAQYYGTLDNHLSARYDAQMLEMADTSRNREWMVKAYLYSAEGHFAYNFLQQNISRGLARAEKALAIAKENNLHDLTIWSYLYLARGSLVNGEPDKALNYNHIALSMATDVTDDSLRVNVFNVLGDIYLAKNEKLLAFRNYLQAMDIASGKGKYMLLKDCYGNLGAFYTSLENFEKAKDYLYKKEALQVQQGRRYDLLNTWRELAVLYIYAKEYEQALRYYEKAIDGAKKLHYEQFNYMVYLSIVNMYFISDQYEKGLAYFNEHKEIKDFLQASGMGFLIDQSYGAMYAFSGKLDSAGYYLKRAEPAMENNVNKVTRYWFYFQMAYYYKKLGDYDKAINYWQRAKSLGDQIGELSLQQRAATNLDSLYQLKGDFKSAYQYQALQSQYKDSLQNLAREKDLLSLEIDNENRRKEREVLREQAETQRRHNIQYMGITVCIAIVFILLVMAGVFSVSKTTIKILGFFAFILLFEFIIMIADNKIHHMTHGEPWMVLAIKIGLIAILLPLHHRLEEKAIHYLTTQELLRIKGRGMIRKWFRKKSADLPMRNM